MPPVQKTDTPADYNFILQSTQPKKRKLSFGGSRRQRIFVVVVALLVLIALAYGFLAIVRSQNSKGHAELVDLAAYQTELVRIIDIGVKEAQSVSVKAGAQTASLSILSDLNQTKNFIRQKNIPAKSEDLTKYNTPSIDEQLASAKTANNFDATYSQLVDEKLNSYKAKLADVFAAQTDNTIRETLRVFKTHAELLAFTYSPSP